MDASSSVQVSGRQRERLTSKPLPAAKANRDKRLWRIRVWRGGEQVEAKTVAWDHVERVVGEHFSPDNKLAQLFDSSSLPDRITFKKIEGDVSVFTQVRDGSSLVQQEELSKHASQFMEDVFGCFDELAVQEDIDEEETGLKGKRPIKEREEVNLQATIAQQAKRIEQLQTTNQELEKHASGFHRLESENQSLRAEQDRLSRELGEVNKSFELFRTDRERLNQRLSQQHQELSQAQEELKRAKQTIETKTQELEALKQDLSAAQKKHEQGLQRVAASQQTEEMQQAHAVEIQGKQAAVERAEQQLHVQNDQIKALQESIKKQEQHVQTLKDEVQRATRDKEQVARELGQSKEEFARAQSTYQVSLKNLEDRLVQAERKTSAVQEQLNHQTREFKNSSVSVGELEGQLKAALEETHRIREEMAQLRSGHEAAIQRNQQAFEQQIEQLKQQLEASKKNLQKAQGDRLVLQGRLEHAQKESAERGRKVNALQQVLAESASDDVAVQRKIYSHSAERVVALEQQVREAQEKEREAEGVAEQLRNQLRAKEESIAALQTPQWLEGVEAPSEMDAALLAKLQEQAKHIDELKARLEELQELNRAKPVGAARFEHAQEVEKGDRALEEARAQVQRLQQEIGKLRTQINEQEAELDELSSKKLLASNEYEMKRQRNIDDLQGKVAALEKQLKRTSINLRKAETDAADARLKLDHERKKRAEAERKIEEFHKQEQVVRANEEELNKLHRLVVDKEFERQKVHEALSEAQLRNEQLSKKVLEVESDNRRDQQHYQEQLAKGQREIEALQGQSEEQTTWLRVAKQEIERLRAENEAFKREQDQKADIELEKLSKEIEGLKEENDRLNHWMDRIYKGAKKYLEPGKDIETLSTRDETLQGEGPHKANHDVEKLLKEIERLKADNDRLNHLMDEIYQGAQHYLGTGTK